MLTRFWGVFEAGPWYSEDVNVTTNTYDASIQPHDPGGFLPKHVRLPGSMHVAFIRCGRPWCRCRNGERHGPYWYLYWDDGQRPRKTYIPVGNVEQVRAAIAVWREQHPPAWAVRQELAAIRRLWKELIT